MNDVLSLAGQADLLFQLYRGYADSSYFHDERGFQAPTPFGDMADVLLSDSPATLFRQYPVLVVAGSLCHQQASCAEIADKLEEYVLLGGILVLSSSNLALFPSGLLNATSTTSSCQVAGAGNYTLTYPALFPKAQQGTETQSGIYCDVDVSQAVDASFVSIGSLQSPQQGSISLGVASSFSKGGALIVLSSDLLLGSTPAVKLPVVPDVDETMPVVYPLLSSSKDVLEAVYVTSASPVSVNNDNLTYSMNYISQSELYVGVFNPSYEQQNFVMAARSSPSRPLSVVEIALGNDTAADSVGYTPETVNASTLGKDTATTIAGGSARLFHVVLPFNMSSMAAPIPLGRPRQVGLWPGSRDESPAETVLRRPTFFEHYETLIVDWQSVRIGDTLWLEQQARFARLQKLRVVIDLSSSINMYPALRLVNNSASDSNATFTRIRLLFEAAATMNVSDIVVSWHRCPENYYSQSACSSDLLHNTALLMQIGDAHNLTLHIRNKADGQVFTPLSAALIVKSLCSLSGLDNIRLFIGANEGFGANALTAVANVTEFMMVACAEQDDLTGTIWTTTGSLSTCGPEQLGQLQQQLGLAQQIVPSLTFVAGHQSSTADEEYREVRELEALMRAPSERPGSNARVDLYSRLRQK